MAGNNPIGLFPVFFCMTTFIIVVFTANIVKDKYKFAIVVTIFKNVKGKVLSDF